MTRAQAAQQARAVLDTIENKQGVRAISGYYHNLNEAVFVHEITALLLATHAACLEEAIKGCEREAYELSLIHRDGGVQLGMRYMLEQLRSMLREQAAQRRRG